MENSFKRFYCLSVNHIGSRGRRSEVRRKGRYRPMFIFLSKMTLATWCRNIIYLTDVYLVTLLLLLSKQYVYIFQIPSCPGIPWRKNKTLLFPSNNFKLPEHLGIPDSTRVLGKPWNCHVPEISLTQPFICDMVHRRAGGSNYKMVNCGHKGMAHGQRQYSDHAEAFKR